MPVGSMSAASLVDKRPYLGRLSTRLGRQLGTGENYARLSSVSVILAIANPHA